MVRTLTKFNASMIMEKQNSPATWGRCFFLGLGIGTGITIGLYVAKKLSQSNCSHELVLAVNDMSHEIRELRSCLMINYEKTNSSDRLKKLYRCVSSHEVTTKTEYLAPEESSTEDDFFDLQEDDEQISNSERLLFLVSIKNLCNNCLSFPWRGTVVKYSISSIHKIVLTKRGGQPRDKSKLAHVCGPFNFYG